MIGYHVHEKAILTTILLVSLESAKCVQSAQLLVNLATVGVFSFFPLFTGLPEMSIKVLLWIGWIAELHSALSPSLSLSLSLSRDYPWYSTVRFQPLRSRIQYLSLFSLFLFTDILHPILFLIREREKNGEERERLTWSFLPRLLTSVYCAVLLLVCWWDSFILLNKTEREKEREMKKE